MSGVGLRCLGSAAVVKDGITMNSSEARGAAGSFLAGSGTSLPSDAQRGSWMEQGVLTLCQTEHPTISLLAYDHSAANMQGF